MSVLQFPPRLRVIPNAPNGSPEQVIASRLRAAFREEGHACPRVVIAIERKRNGEMEHILIFVPYDDFLREHLAEALFHPKFGIASVEKGRPGVMPMQGLPGEPQEDAPLYWQVSFHECVFIEENLDAWREAQQEE